MFKRFVSRILFCLIAVLLCAIGIPLQETEAGQATQAEWTILVFANGDNNLEYWTIEDINEMEMVGSTASVNIVVQIDRIPGGDASNGDWTDTRRYYIVHDTSQQIASIRLDTPPDTLGELNMGNPQTLVNFVNWGIDHYPAKHYAMIMWDHGSGWYKELPGDTGSLGDDLMFKAGSFDDTDHDTLGVSNGEWQSALSQIKSHLGRKIDLIGFDACLMQMWEVLDISDEYGDYMVGSEEVELVGGWDYTPFLDSLIANPLMSPVDLGKQIVDVTVNGEYQATMSCVDLAQIPSLTTHVKELSYELVIASQNPYLRDILENYRELLDSFNHNFEYRDHIDLYDYVVLLIGDSRLPTSLTNKAWDVYYAVRNAVTHRHNQPEYYWTRGIAIYYPHNTLAYDHRYDNLPVTATTYWDTFIAGFIRGDANGDRHLTISDVNYLIDYLIKGGPAPVPALAGDANCNGQVSIADAVYLINYLFKGGPPPAC